MSEINGVLRVDKPEGPTSHDVVAIARRTLGLRRIGHTGTLDPFASGLLLLCLGPATRLAEYLTALPKSYTATMRLGEVTDTDDATGEVISRSDAAESVTREALLEALRRQTGIIDQLPPSYSAKKVGGERMYAAARRGTPLERTPSRVTVHAIQLLRFEPPLAEFSVNCSSGTYIRSIARDVGEELGVGGHLTHLRRTCVGSHHVDAAVRVDELGDEAAFRRAFLSPADAVSHLPSQLVTDEQMAPLGHGGAIPAADDLPEGRPVAMLATSGELLAIGERTGSRLQPRKVLL
jgi:tRNA pseudouridine55 synthase